mmetsp:Transcript_7273/g.15092  ORF Transcript_7273/g.15092 Transcript_7273/m.15092 type:complete len:254 (-) Transcript_7273:62-823(-)
MTSWARDRAASTSSATSPRGSAPKTARRGPSRPCPPASPARPPSQPRQNTTERRCWTPTTTAGEWGRSPPPSRGSPGWRTASSGVSRRAPPRSRGPRAFPRPGAGAVWMCRPLPRPLGRGARVTSLPSPVLRWPWIPHQGEKNGPLRMQKAPRPPPSPSSLLRTRSLPVRSNMLPWRRSRYRIYWANDIYCERHRSNGLRLSNIVCLWTLLETFFNLGTNTPYARVAINILLKTAGYYQRLCLYRTFKIVLLH